MTGDDASVTPTDDGASSSPQDTGTVGTPTDGGTTHDAGLPPDDGANESPFPFKPAYILGADISWETQHEAEGYTYSDGKSTKTMSAIMAENGFNFIRLRTFVDPAASANHRSLLRADSSRLR